AMISLTQKVNVTGPFFGSGCSVITATPSESVEGDTISSISLVNMPSTVAPAMAIPNYLR
ncbi:MAG: hypothetical protein OEM82_13840, partial [Acidobacteriota bacterium]|nr:hypothetical protein [Acidobacteriota bacterium]